MVKQSVIIHRNPPDDLPIFHLKIGNFFNNYGLAGKKKDKSANFYQKDFPAWLTFFLDIVCFHVILGG